MKNDLQVYLEGIDKPLLITALTLLLIGLVMVTSASLQIAETRMGMPSYYAIRHAIYLAMGLTLAAIAFSVPPVWLSSLRYVWLVAAPLLLLMVFLPGLGREVNGSTRWISLGGFTVQPSEIAKLAFVLYLSSYIAERRDRIIAGWPGFLMPLGVLVILVGLLLLEPDFGASVVLAATTMTMLFLAGVPLKRFLLVILAGVMLVAAVAVAQPYRMARLTAFLDPWSDRFGSGYQLTQSLIAFGRGHVSGVGLGNSVQKLFYLPEAHTDFVYAVLAEETGLLGNILMISLFVFLGMRVYRIGIRTMEKGDLFVAQMIFGIAMLFCSQAFINISVNMGLLPTKGLTLPFVSYGGSSLLVSCVMLGLVLRAGVELKKKDCVAQKNNRSAKGAVK